MKTNLLLLKGRYVYFLNVAIHLVSAQAHTLKERHVILEAFIQLTVWGLSTRGDNSTHLPDCKLIRLNINAKDHRQLGFMANCPSLYFI